MRSRKFAVSRTEVLKYSTVLAILIYIILLMLYASGSTKPFQQVAEQVEGSIRTESLIRQDSQALKRYYGLNSADYEGVLFYSSEFSISAEEVLLIEVKSERQVQEVRDAVNARLESRKNAFDGYAPAQVQLLEDAQFLVRGKYIFLAVSQDAESSGYPVTHVLWTGVRFSPYDKI